MYIMMFTQVFGLLFFGYPNIGKDSTTITTKIEIIDTVRSYATPCWGQHAPKIVRNANGELWAVTLRGKIGDEQAQIMKREVSGTWKKGKKFDQVYQPSMIFLDGEGRLNYIENSQKEAIKHYRSTDNENLNNFELVASGNGLEDGRGWYIGVGINGSTMYLSYITLQGDLFLTWKKVSDTSWHNAILIESGKTDTVTGNQAWVYPRFNFHKGKGYITASGSMDGSKQNTYNTVRLVTFSLSNPEGFKKEIVYDGAVGYTSFSYDAMITANDKIICGFNAGTYRYGKKRKDVLTEGIYVAVRDIKGSKWSTYQVDDRSGGIALQQSPDGSLYALLMQGKWDTKNAMLLKRSVDGGKIWTIVDEDLLKDRSDITRGSFLQVARSHSGSVPGLGIDGLFTNTRDTTNVDGLRAWDLVYLHIDLNRK